MRSASVSGIVTGAAPVCYWPIFSRSLVKVPKVFAKINSAQFSGAEMSSASFSGIVTGPAPVRYRPIFSPSLVKVPKVFAKINSAQISSRVSRTQLLWSSVKFSHQRYVSIIRFIR